MSVQHSAVALARWPRVLGLGLVGFVVAASLGGTIAAAGETWRAGATGDLTLDEEAAIAKFQKEARAAGALGFYEGGEGSLMALVPTDRMAAVGGVSAVDLPFETRLKATALDQHTLEQVKNDLRAVPEKYPLDTIVFGLDPKLQKIVVYTTLDQSIINAAVGNEADLIHYGYGKVQRLGSRQAATEPFWAGAAISFPDGAGCTSGMSVLLSGGNGPSAALTAGHCGILNDRAYTPSGTYFGTLTQRVCGGSTGKDMALLTGATYSPYIFLGGSNSSTGSRVMGAADPLEGTNVYRYSGKSTGENGPYTVVNSDWDAYFGPNECDPWSTHVSAFTRYVFGTPACDAARGDSGAPFFFKTSGNNVYIRGMVIGITPQVYCIAENWTRIKNTFNVVIKT